MPSRLSLARGPRAALLAGLVLLTVGLAGALAWEAYRASKSHRLTAERLLRDYASFAAFELLANAEKSLEGTLAVAFGPVIRTAESPYETLLAPSVLAATADSILRCERPSEDTVRAYFRIDFGDGRGFFSGPSGGNWVRDTVLAHFRKQYQPSSGYATVLEDGGKRAVVYGVKYAPHRAPLAVYGIVTCASALEAPLFREVLARGPLLPAAVTASVPEDSLISILVRDASGHRVFSAGPGAQSRFVAEANSARLGGLSVRAALVPSAVERLALAQAPSPRLPFLIGLLALTVALATVAVIQLRREHELARLRTDFVSSVSHELRTPLAQILLFGETLALDRARSDDARRQAAQTIVDEARRLIRMVENVLQFSRTQRVKGDAGRAPEIAPTHLSPVLESVMASFQPLARQGGAKVKSAVEDNVVALADTESMRQILLNLLDNAVKYGPKGQTITVGATRTGSAARVWVEDEGAGVPEAERQQVFERFVRGGRRNGSRGGTGLGLAVVKELVALQGGRVWIESGALRGARFVVELRSGALDQVVSPAGEGGRRG